MLCVLCVIYSVHVSMCADEVSALQMWLAFSFLNFCLFLRDTNFNKN